MLIAQFIYCSCKHDGPYDTGPGWKVAELSAVAGRTDELDELVRQAATRVGMYKPVRAPEYASRELIESLPSSMRLDRVSGDVYCLMRSTSAGQDYSRRPAAFSHGVLVKLTGQALASRPAEFWDWGWLTPIDADEIESATLTDAAGELSSNALSPQSIMPFALGRPEVTGPLMIAFAHCLTTKSTLVLIEPDPAVAACWFAALQYLMSPAATWRLPFDTYQEPEAMLHRLEDGPRLIAVAEIDSDSVGQLVRSGRILVAAEQPADEASLHPADALLNSGVQKHPWAELALRLLEAGSEAACSVIARIDELSSMLDQGGWTSPMWALPAALLTTDFPLTAHDRELAAGLCISLWPSTEQMSQELIDQLRAQVLGPSMPFSTMRELAEQLVTTREKPDALSDMVLCGYLTGLLSESMKEAPSRPWLPPLVRLISGPAMAELVGTVPALLNWTTRFGVTEPGVAAAFMIGACLVAEAPSSDQRMQATAWLEPRIGDLLEELVSSNYAVSERVSRAMTALPPSVWEYLLDPALSGMLAESEPVEADAPPSVTGYNSAARDDGYYYTASGHLSWRIQQPGGRPSPVPRRLRPGTRWPAAVHELLGAAGLDGQLSGDLQLLRFTPLLAEHAAYRARTPKPGLNPDAVSGLAFWAQVRTTAATARTPQRVLRAALEAWPDLSEMLPVAPQLLNQLDPMVDTRLLLDRLLAMIPLGEASALLSTPGARAAKPPSRFQQFHQEESRQPIITRAQAALVAEARLNNYFEWSKFLHIRMPDQSRALAVSISIRSAAVLLCLDLVTVLTIWQLSHAQTYIIARVAQRDWDFDEAWRLILQGLQNPAESGITESELGELLAYLHLRSIMQHARDPALIWLATVAEAGAELPMTGRLRNALATADDKVLAAFRDHVARGADHIAQQDRLIAASGAANAKEFHKIVNTATARIFDESKGTKFGFNRSRP